MVDSSSALGRVSLVEHGKAAETMKLLKRRSTGTSTAASDADTDPWADLLDGKERRMSAVHNHHNYNPEVKQG